jgi:hypothetical protein
MADNYGSLRGIVSPRMNPKHKDEVVEELCTVFSSYPLQDTEVGARDGRV